MATYLVTRHPGTRLWAEAMAKHGRLPMVIDHILEHLDSKQLAKGDVVVGTLPVHLAASLHAMGVKFWSLDIDVPPAERGQELSGVQLVKYGARFIRYEVREKETESVEARRVRAAAKPQTSITLIPVSEQLAPAAIGWLHEPTEQVRLLASAQMAGQANRLKHWLRQRDPAPKVVILPWDDADYAHLLAQAEDLAMTLALENRSRVVINLTGGTKPMTMALQRAFGKRAEVFGRLLGPYVDTSHKRIEDMLSPQMPVTPLRSVLGIGDMLSLQGFKLSTTLSAGPQYQRWTERTALFDILLSAGTSDWLSIWYQALNGAAWLLDKKSNRSNADKTTMGFVATSWNRDRANPRFTVTFQRPWGALQSALNGAFGAALQASGVCEWTLPPDQNQLTLTFDLTRQDELAFARGGWMEIWLANQFSAAGVDDWGQGLQVTREGTCNEFDLIAACGNRMLLVEVKTANMKNDGVQDTRAAETVYKLDALGEKLGRYFNQRWLVSLHPLSEPDRERASKHGVRVFEIRDAKGAPAGVDKVLAAIREWVKESALPPDKVLRKATFNVPRAPMANALGSARVGDTP